MNYELEKHFETVYTISKFREVQDEFKGKDVISASEGPFGTMYEVREDVFYGEHKKKNMFFVLISERDI